MSFEYKKLSHADVVKTASDLKSEVAAIYAVLEVESKGNGFITLPDVNESVPIILFERHKMYKYLTQKGIDTSKLPSDIVNKDAGGYKSSVEEHKRLERAVRIDRECALKSCSWGLFQVMGFNWEAMQYPSLQEFINCMYRNEYEHLVSFARYVRYCAPAALVGLQTKDWAKLAKNYNGSNYAINKYDIKLAAAYKKYKAIYP